MTTPPEVLHQHAEQTCAHELAVLAAHTHPRTPHPDTLPDYAHRTLNDLQATLELRKQLWTDFGKERG